MATSVFTDEVLALRRRGLSELDISRALAVAPQTVRAWTAGTRRPGPRAAERIAVLVGLVERLEAVMDAEYVPLWLRKPIPRLGNEKPLDVIQRGEWRRIVEALSGADDLVAI